MPRTPDAENQLQLDIDAAEALRPLWEETLAAAEPRLGREARESWLAESAPLSLQGGCLLLGVSNATARTWIEKKYAPTLAELLSELRGEPTRVEVVVHKSLTKSRAADPQPAARPAAPTVPAKPAISPLFSPIPLHEKYTFENLVVGQSNRFAHAAATAVAERPGREFNPLFVYGGVGLGKTHLLQAIGHAFRAANPRARVAYVSGETFTSHFVTSLRERKEEDFRRAYRSVDIWLVDDVQFIADKTSTKEEFFHTFNELYLTNRQIVLASDRPPRELRLMEDRLRTRLESGLMVEIGAPDLEMRMAILEKRAELEGADVPPEVIHYIARGVTQNVRLLEAALIRMLALASLTHSSINAELAARALGAFVEESRRACISVMAILRAVCTHFQVSEDELVSARRDRRICLARQVAMYLLRDLARKPLVEIGQLFGGKSHSTVLYSCAKLEKEMETDPDLSAAVRALRGELGRE